MTSGTELFLFLLPHHTIFRGEDVDFADEKNIPGL